MFRGVVCFSKEGCFLRQDGVVVLEGAFSGGAEGIEEAHIVEHVVPLEPRAAEVLELEVEYLDSPTDDDHAAGPFCRCCMLPANVRRGCGESSPLFREIARLTAGVG